MHVHDIDPSAAVMSCFPPSDDTLVAVEEATTAALKSSVPVALEE